MTVYIVRCYDNCNDIEDVYLDHEEAKQKVEELKQRGYYPWIDEREVIE